MYDWVESLESYVDSLLIDSALEAEGSDDEGSPSGVASKFRKALSKFKLGKKKKDKKMVDEANKELQEANDELEEGMENAETPEEKKKWSKTAKVALAIAAVIATIVGAVAISKKLGKASANKGDTAPENTPNLVSQTLNVAANSTTNNIDKVPDDKTTASNPVVSAATAASKVSDLANSAEVASDDSGAGKTLAVAANAVGGYSRSKHKSSSEKRFNDLSDLEKTVAKNVPTINKAITDLFNKDKANNPKLKNVPKGQWLKEKTKWAKRQGYSSFQAYLADKGGLDLK